MSNKTEFMCFNQDGKISLNGKPMEEVNQLTYLSHNLSFTVRCHWQIIHYIEIRSQWKNKKDIFLSCRCISKTDSF